MRISIKDLQKMKKAGLKIPELLLIMSQLV